MVVVVYERQTFVTIRAFLVNKRNSIEIKNYLEKKKTQIHLPKPKNVLLQIGYPNDTRDYLDTYFLLFSSFILLLSSSRIFSSCLSRHLIHHSSFLKLHKIYRQKELCHTVCISFYWCIIEIMYQCLRMFFLHDTRK